MRFEIDASGTLDSAPLLAPRSFSIGAGRGMVSAGFPKDAVTESALLTDYVSWADSGSVMHRRFCALGERISSASADAIGFCLRLGACYWGRHPLIRVQFCVDS